MKEFKVQKVKRTITQYVDADGDTYDTLRDATIAVLQWKLGSESIPHSVAVWILDNREAFAKYLTNLPDGVDGV